MTDKSALLLKVEQLTVSTDASGGVVRILEGVDLALHENETLGIVGESGSGKSTLAAALTRLLGSGLSISGGRMIFNGEDILTMSARRLRRLRGSEIATILGISARTVEKHVEAILRALQAENRATAIVRAMERSGPH